MSMNFSGDEELGKILDSDTSENMNNFLFTKEELEELELEIDEKLLIRPITEGLGFHHDQSNKGLDLKTFSDNRKFSAKNHHEEFRNNFVGKNQNDLSLKRMESLGQEISQNDLSEFYKKEPVQETGKNLYRPREIKKKKKEKKIMASVLRRTSAFILDVFFLLSLNIIMLISLYFLIGQGFSWYGAYKFIHSFFEGPIYILFLINNFYFIFYNAFLDGTLGKRVLKIKIEQDNSKRLDFEKSLYYQLCFLTSFVLIFPLILDIHNKLWQINIFKK